MCREWETLKHFFSKWDVFIHPILIRQRIYLEVEAETLQKPEVMNDCNIMVSSKHNRSDEHINSQLWQHTRNREDFESDAVPALRDGIGQKDSTLTKMLFPMNNSGKGDNQIFPRICHHTLGPDSCPGIVISHKANFIYKE